MDIARNQVFHVRADHDGLDATTYELRIDGAAAQSQPVSALQGGSITFSNLLVSTLGAHSLLVRAVGPAGQADSSSVPFDVIPAAPSAPANVVITIV